MRYYISIHIKTSKIRPFWQKEYDCSKMNKFLTDPNHPNQSDFSLIFCGKLIWQENQYNKIWESEKCEKFSQSVTY